MSLLISLTNSQTSHLGVLCVILIEISYLLGQQIDRHIVAIRILEMSSFVSCTFHLELGVRHDADDATRDGFRDLIDRTDRIADDETVWDTLLHGDHSHILSFHGDRCQICSVDCFECVFNLKIEILNCENYFV